jgi:hypothetical protein
VSKSSLDAAAASSALCLCVLCGNVLKIRLIMSIEIGIIGGSGLYDMAELTDRE